MGVSQSLRVSPGDADLQSDEHIDLKNLSQQELDQMFGNIKVGHTAIANKSETQREGGSLSFTNLFTWQAPSRTFSDKSLMSSLYGGGSAHSSFDSTGRPVSIDSASSRHSRQNSSSGGQ